MDAIVVFGRDSDLDLRSGHRLADSVSSFLCSDLCNFGDLIWANHETICKQRRQCIKLPWGIVCTFPVSRIFLPTAWALPPYQGVWYQYVCLQSRKLCYSALRKSVITPYLRQRTWVSFWAKFFPLLSLREKVYKTSPCAKQNLPIWCVNVCTTADQVRGFRSMECRWRESADRT